MIADNDLQRIVDVVIAKALQGDLTAAGMILDRRLPRLRMQANVDASVFGLEELIAAANDRPASANAFQRDQPIRDGVANPPAAHADARADEPAPERTPSSNRLFCPSSCERRERRGLEPCGKGLEAPYADTSEPYNPFNGED